MIRRLDPSEYTLISLGAADCGDEIGMPLEVCWWLADSFEVEQEIEVEFHEL